MNTYAVRFLKGTDIEVAYVQGESKLEAKKKFSKIYPDIDSDKIISVDNIQEQSNDYGTAISVTKFIVFLGWVNVIAGIAVVISGGFLVVGVSGTIGIITSGFMLIMGGQITRATADSANYSKQMLEEMRNRK